MAKLTYKKPSGVLIQIGDTAPNKAYAKELGWTLIGGGDEPTKAPKDMTVDELRAALMSAGVDVSADAKKAELVELVEAAAEAQKAE